MGMFDPDDVRGYCFSSTGNVEYVCPECVTAEDEITEEAILVERDLEEKLCFCDRCKKQIAG